MNKIFLALFFIVIFVAPVYGYIDPGTGSMLFSLLMGIATAVFFFLKNAFLRLKNFSFTRQKLPFENKRRRFVFYSEGKQYWNVFRPVLEELARRGIPASYYTSDRDDPGLQSGLEGLDARFIGVANTAFRTLNLLEAETCVTTTPGLDVFQFRRSPGVTRHVHILHAPTDPTLYKLFSFDYYDALLLTGPYQEPQIRRIEEKRDIKPKKLPVVGCTYLDVLAARLEAGEVQKRDGAILVAPSWGANGILKRFGLDLLVPLARTGLPVIIRPHPQSSISEAKLLASLETSLSAYPNVEWNYERENLDTLARADVLISDFSGIIFDFAFLFGRPILYPSFEFDYRPYDASDLDEEPWTFQTLRRIGIAIQASDFENIGTIIEGAKSDQTRSRAIQEAREEAYAYPREAGRRAVDALLELERSEANQGH